MDLLDFDNNLVLYIVLSVVFIAFFFWNNTRLKKNRQSRKGRNFRTRYMERKKELEKDKE